MGHSTDKESIARVRKTVLYRNTPSFTSSSTTSTTTRSTSIRCALPLSDSINEYHLQMSQHDRDEEPNDGASSDENDDSVYSSSAASRPPTLSESNIPRLCCALLASITTGGTTYAFGLYGSALKKNLHLTQSQLDTISTANFCAGLLSWIPGLCVDRFGTRVGISMGASIGAVALCLYWQVAKGYNSILAAATIEYTVATLSALGVTIFLSCALVTGSVFKIIVKSCGPGTKGSAVGAAKGYVGLGAGAYACLFESIRQPTTSDLDFLLMAAFFFIVMAAIPSFLALPNKYQEDHGNVPDSSTDKHYRLIYASLIAMAMAIVGTSLLSLYDHDDHEVQRQQQTPALHKEKSSSATHDYRMTVFIMFVWMAPLVGFLFLPRRPRLAGSDNDEQDSLLQSPDSIRQHQQESERSISSASCDNGLMTDSNRKTESLDERRKLSDQESLTTIDDDQKDAMTTTTATTASTTLSATLQQDEMEVPTHDDGEQVGLVEQTNDRSEERPAVLVDVQEDKNLIQMLQTPSAWLMLWTTTILVGGGTVETNNMGQMVESLHFTADVTPASLALFSVAQAGARVVSGAVSEAALNWSIRGFGIGKGIPRPFFFVVASLLGFLAHVVLAVSGENQTLFIVGVTIAGASFGTVWPLMVLISGEVFGQAHVAANYMFYDGFTSAGGTLLLSKVIAQEVYERHIDDSVDDGVTCYGAACFQATHAIIALLSLTCVITSVAMQYSTRHIYNKNRLHEH